MSAPTDPEPRVVADSRETLWFLGTLARMKLDGRDTGGRASPPRRADRRCRR